MPSDELLAERDALRARVERLETALRGVMNSGPSADEFRLMVVRIGGTSDSAQALMPQIDALDAALKDARAVLAEKPAPEDGGG